MEGCPIGTEWYFKALDSLPFSSCAIDMQSGRLEGRHQHCDKVRQSWLCVHIQKHQCMKNLYAKSRKPSLHFTNEWQAYCMAKCILHLKRQNSTAMRFPLSHLRIFFEKKHPYHILKFMKSSVKPSHTVPEVVLLFGWRRHTECACRTTPGCHLGLSATLRLTGRA